jgi:hypothetical protein
MVAKMQLMEGTVGVQMPANEIRIKRDENTVIQTPWNNLKTSVRGAASDGLTKYQHIVLYHYE